MKRTLYIALFLTVACMCHAQKYYENVDSLINVLETQTMTGKEKLELYKSIFESTGDSRILIRYFNDGLSLAQAEKDKSKESFFNEYMGRVYFAKSMFDSVSFYFDKALELAIESKDSWQESSVYTSYAVMYGFRSMYREFIEYQLKAMTIYEKDNDNHGLSGALSNIGAAYSSLNDNKSAIEYFEKSMAIAEEINHVVLIASLHYSLGAAYFALKDYEKTEQHLLKALEKSQKLNVNTMMDSHINTGLAELYSTGIIDLEKAEKYGERGLELAKQIHNPQTQANAYKGIANVYRHQNRYKECDAAATKAWELDSENMEVTISVTANLAHANIKLGNLEKASIFFEKYDSIVHKYTEKSIHNTFIGQQIKYETEKKELRIAALEKEKKLQYLITFLGVFALLIVTILFILNRKMNKQKIKQLEQEKQIIASQAIIEGETEERKRLARDLHDGLGGMLSAVKINLDNIEQLQNARDLLGKSIDELRRLSHNLMPSALQYGLPVALEEFCNAIPNAHFHFYGTNTKIDDKIKLLFYRCTYELVNNAVKHANAENINVQFVQETNRIALTVTDDGCGFDTNKKAQGMGLQNIKDRVVAFNGTIEIVSAPEKGTEVFIVLKIES